MSPFRSINFPGSPAAGRDDRAKTSPQTPQPKETPLPTQTAIAATTPIATATTGDEGATPTRASFSVGAMALQRPLPTSPFPDLAQNPAPGCGSEPPEPKTPLRVNSKRSAESRDRDSDDMDVDRSPDEGTRSDDSPDHSDEEESKKKKQKKTTHFYCTGWANCNLSFTRSEHLARHIRKHTGERPFECHCKRTFSRLDNLRQHAQTVHLNEDIPPDSLAASGTRYQKSLGRPTLRHGPRARASTGGSAGRPIRGHSKSLSTSSISSIGPIPATADPRRRPPPLVMADSQQPRLPFESYRPEGALPTTPSEFSTPTSATFSTGQDSPQYGLSSPNFSHSQSYHARRLSVPSGGHLFMHGGNSPQYYPPPAGMGNSGSGPFSPGNSSLLSSPTASVASGWSRRESVSRAAEDAFRRRTWHPDTLQFHRESRLSQVITPAQLDVPAPLAPAPRPANSEQQQQQTTLPSVQSLLRMVDSEPANSQALASESGMVTESRRNSELPSEWDRSLHRRINELDINNSPGDGAGTWASETNQAVLAQAERVRVIQGPPTVRFTPEVETGYGSPTRGPMRHHHTMSAPVVNYTPGDTRRHAWHNGPVPNRQPPETIHEGRQHIDRLEHPNLNQFSGFPARNNPLVIHQHPAETANPRPAADRSDNRRFDVLVAAASSIETATATATTNGYRGGASSHQKDMMMEPRGDHGVLSSRAYPVPGQFAQPYRRCHKCGRADTPEWRPGPDGPETLCNSCGLEYLKLETRRQAERRFEPRRFEQFVGPA